MLTARRSSARITSYIWTNKSRLELTTNTSLRIVGNSTVTKTVSMANAAISVTSIEASKRSTGISTWHILLLWVMLTTTCLQIVKLHRMEFSRINKLENRMLLRLRHLSKLLLTTQRPRGLKYLQKMSQLTGVMITKNTTISYQSSNRQTDCRSSYPLARWKNRQKRIRIQTKILTSRLKEAQSCWRWCHLKRRRSETKTIMVSVWVVTATMRAGPIHLSRS